MPLAIVLLEAVLGVPLMASYDSKYGLRLPILIVWTHAIVALLMLINIIFFIMAAILFCRAKNDTAMANSHSSQAKQK